MVVDEQKLEKHMRIDDILFNLNIAIQSYNKINEINGEGFHFVDLLNLDYPHDMSDEDWKIYIEHEKKMIEHLKSVLFKNIARKIIKAHQNASLLELIIK